jgi:hypothetical protein
LRSQRLRLSTLRHGAVAKAFQVRLYTVTGLVRMLHEVGFHHVEASDGLDGGEVTPESRLALRAVP